MVTAKGEKSLMKDIVRYAHMLENSAKLLMEAFESYLRDGSAYQFYDEIDVLEKNADDVRREIVNRLARSAYFAFLSEDFIKLVNLMDEVVDYARGALKLLVESGIKQESIGALDADRLKSFLNLVVKSVSSLKDAIAALENHNRESIIDKTRLVELYEEEADAVKDDLLWSLFKAKDKLEVFDLLIIKELIGLVDSVADRAEDASDAIMGIVSKGYR